MRLYCPDGEKGRAARDAFAVLVNEHSTNALPGNALLSYLWPYRIPASELAGYAIALNFHPAPLPDYKGFAPYTFGILSGATEWGVSCHRMTADIDGGPIAEVRRFPIDEPATVTAASLQAQTLPHLEALFRSVARLVLRGYQLPMILNAGGAYHSRADFERLRTNAVPRGDADRYRRAFHCPPWPGFGE